MGPAAPWGVDDSLAIRVPLGVWRHPARLLVLPGGVREELETATYLSIDPATGERLWDGTTGVDINGGLAAFKAAWHTDGSPRVLHEEIVAVDLETRERRQLTDAPGLQYNPTMTAEIVAWVDMRSEPTLTSMRPCSADIYGFDRATGEELPLVTEGDVMHGPGLDAEGPWLAYDDQRWDADPLCYGDRPQSIVAFHVPTRTELRITGDDWPAWEAAERVYQRGDGSYGVIFIEEISYGAATYRLWDCDLPAP